MNAWQWLRRKFRGKRRTVTIETALDLALECVRLRLTVRELEDECRFHCKAKEQLRAELAEARKGVSRGC